MDELLRSSSQNHTADYSVLSQPWSYLVVECYLFLKQRMRRDGWWYLTIEPDVLDYLLYLSSTYIPCWVKENRCDSPWSVQCPQIVDVTRILRFTAMLNVLLRYFCMCTVYSTRWECTSSVQPSIQIPENQKPLSKYSALQDKSSIVHSVCPPSKRLLMLR